MLQSDLFCTGAARDTNILRPELILKKNPPLYLVNSVSRTHNLYRYIDDVYCSIFLKNKPPFMADTLAINLFASPLPHW